MQIVKGKLKGMVDQFENCFVKVRLLQFVDGRCSMGNVVQVYGFVWLSKTCSNTNLQGFKNAKLTILHFRTATFCIDIVVSSWIEIVLFPTASYEHQEFAFVQLKKTKKKKRKGKKTYSFIQPSEWTSDFIEYLRKKTYWNYIRIQESVHM